MIMARSSFLLWSCCCLCILLCSGSLAKECTNVPTQHRSHTKRAMMREREIEVASADNVSSIESHTALASSGSPFSPFSTSSTSSWRKLSPVSKGRPALHAKPRLRADFSKVVDEVRRNRQEHGQARENPPNTSIITAFAKWMNSVIPGMPFGSPSSGVRLAASNPVRVASPLLKEIPLHKIKLAAHSPHGIAQETNLKYLLMLEVDRLVWSFRVTAGLPTPGLAYGGWEDPSMELRGHFVGHFLSASALMWTSTRNEPLRKKMEQVLDALAECQDQISNGYLSAFPEEFFDRFEAIRPVWAPYYTIHKIMAGLLDQYNFAESEKALEMLLWMVEYFLKRVESVIHKQTIERHWESLNEEVGGMNDVLYRLYTITGDADHFKLAHLFDKPCFLGLLSLQTDGLSGFHSNTHIPLVIGAQMRFEATEDRLYADLSQYFMEIVTSSHRFATGGTSVNEFWTDPHRHGDMLDTETQESCTTYNMLKVARNLFRWTKDVAYADYYERTLVNGVLGIQRGRQPGVMIYMLPQGPGNSKALSYHGWGTPYDSFWCCYGTGIESFSKLGDSIYFEGNNDLPALFAAQYVSSNLSWHAVGLELTQLVQPLSSRDSFLNVIFEFHNLPENGNGKEAELTGNGKEAELNLRIPSWTKGAITRIRLNEQMLTGEPEAGTYLTIHRRWKAGDKLEVDLPISLSLEQIQDDREIFSSLHAVLFGPYLLAGMTSGDHNIDGVNTRALSSWIVPVAASQSARLYSLSQHLPYVKGARPRDDGRAFAFLLHDGLYTRMGSPPAEGTHEAAHGTFVLSGSGIGNLDKTTPAGQHVTFELYSHPGRFLAHTGINKSLCIVQTDADDQIATITSGHGGKGFQPGYELFRLLPGLSGDESTISIEARTLPGCFLITASDDSITLRCQSKERGIDKLFAIRASFTLESSRATYNPVSFIAKGSNRQYLLFPIQAYMDESYAAYFNITSG